MSRYAEIERRIQLLCQRAEVAADEGLLAEMEDALACGYACALEGDARSARLHRRLDHLAHGLPEPGAAKELRRVALEREALDEATRALRDRLAVMRTLYLRIGGSPSASR